MQLLGGADSVELKLTVPAHDQRALVRSLELDPLDVRLRQVFFFDTPDLDLYHAGIVARARRTQRKPDDSTIKLRPVVPDDLPRKLRMAPDFVVEVDAMPGGFVCSASYKGMLSTTNVRQVVHEDRPLRKLFSKQQRAFFERHAPEGMALDDLTVLGPITVMKLNTVPAWFGRKLVGELWEYPDGSRIVELSTKCRPEETFDVAVRTRSLLAERGVDLSGEQTTKTRTALEFFANMHRSAPSAFTT